MINYNRKEKYEKFYPGIRVVYRASFVGDTRSNIPVCTTASQQPRLCPVKKLYTIDDQAIVSLQFFSIFEKSCKIVSEKSGGEI